MKYVTMRVVAGLSAVLLLSGAEMMKDAATPEGRNAMREFMKSERAPTRMMEMMGSMGGSGMMDGHGMAQPGGARPGK